LPQYEKKEEAKCEKNIFIANPALSSSEPNAENEIFRLMNNDNSVSEDSS
jgi:hypothetical protein